VIPPDVLAAAGGDTRRVIRPAIPMGGHPKEVDSMAMAASVACHTHGSLHQQALVGHSQGDDIVDQGLTVAARRRSPEPG